jgi:hypothetical protein
MILFKKIQVSKIYYIGFFNGNYNLTSIHTFQK